MATVKVTCSCHLPKYEAYGLFAAGTHKRGNDVVWVHSCGRPFKLYWESFLERCPDCWGSFSSPFETLCQACFKIANPGQVYRGWDWARRVDQSQRTATKKPS